MAGRKRSPEQGKSRALRVRAEEELGRSPGMMPGHIESLSPDEARRLAHELEVHQIELEMQNEELRRAQAELEASRARYFDLYELAPVGYLTLSETGMILEANLTAAGLLGVTTAELVTRSMARFIVPEDQDVYYRYRRQLFETGEPQVCEVRLLRAGADPIWARLEAAAAADADARRICRVAASNVTERVRAEEALRESQRILEKKNAEMTRLVYTISHDLRSPLVTIGAFTGEILRCAGEGIFGTVKEDAERILRAVAAMESLLKGLLDFSRAGHSLREKMEDLPLDSIVGAALETLSSKIAGRAVEVVRQADLPCVRGNIATLTELFQNLVENAVKFMGDQPAPRIEIGAVRGGGSPVIFVRDNGIGIEEKHHERVFDLFERLSPGVDGTGVGLAIAKQIVESHGGKIWVESNGSEKGSTFFLTLGGAGDIQSDR